MRDGNLPAFEGAEQTGPVVSLPMRDGNFVQVNIETISMPLLAYL